MEQRPKIRIQPSTFDLRLEWAGRALLVLLWAMAVFCFITLPDTIATHFNFSGEPDDSGSKWTLILLPVLGTILYLGISFLQHYPHIFNYLTPITMENAERQYRLAVRLLRWLKLAILLVFSFILLLTFLTAAGKAGSLGKWALPIVILIIMLPTFLSMAASLRQKKIG